jgi:broad specificity phosphatase PhoE
MADDRGPGARPAARIGLVSLAAAPAIAYRVVLVRHAATSWTGRRWCGRADPPLTAAGRIAARQLAADLHVEFGRPASRTCDARTVALLVSPARRARQTAAPITAAFGVEAVVEADLVEVDVGEAEGFDWPTLETRFPDVAAAIGQGIQPDWPSGETRADVARRAMRAVERIRTAATSGPVIVVAHGAILHAIAAQLIGDGRAREGLGPGAWLRLDPGHADAHQDAPLGAVR